MAAFSFALPTPVKAAKNDIGVDWSVYQGNSGKTVEGDHFAISQIGGTQGGTIYNQSTYESQVNAAKNGGLRVHSYIWYGVGGSSDIGRQALDYFLPRIRQECQWSGQKLYGSAECVWLSLKFTHYQIFYQ
ncbi:hypothetical protein EFP43_03720, partial [Lacticaseibacillus paracasei]|nr:hypothetical protein [Lacticaseibacillus paracasei]